MTKINSLFGLGHVKGGASIASAIGIISCYLLNSYLLLLLLIIFFTYTISKNTNHDPASTVVDEVVGGYLSLLLVSKISLLTMIFCFIYFRLFDIYKPWPISWINNKVVNCFGVVLDDLLAGSFAALATIFSLWLIK